MEWNIGFAVNENILKAIYILVGFFNYSQHKRKQNAISLILSRIKQCHKMDA